MTILAHMTLNRDYPPNPRPGILHLHVGCICAEWADVTTPQAFAEFLAANEGIGWVIVYDSRFPQRGRSWPKFMEKDVCRLWDETELLAALTEVQRRRVADPNYVPTVAEALRHPKEFVEGMREGSV